MIKAQLDLTLDLIESCIATYAKPAPSVYDATYEWIGSNAAWQNINTNWIGKLTLVFSWMPKIVGKDCDFPFCAEGVSLEDSMQAHFISQVLDEGFHIDRGVRLIDPVSQATWASLASAYECLLGVVKQVAASKILHFSFPAFCLIWDNKQIEWLYQRKSRKVVSALDYVDYHKWAQRVLQRSKDKERIVERYGDTYPRVLDKCIWICSKT
jgi:hypothetical protein